MHTTRTAHTSATSSPSAGPTAAEATEAGTGPAGVAAAPADPAEVERTIAELRHRIDEIDETLVALWRERAELSQRIVAARVATGGTRLVLSREREILQRFGSALGPDGVQLGLLLLRAGRGSI